MKKEDNKKRTAKIVELLKKEYGQTRIFLNHKTPFQLLIATILSAQCTDKKVNEVTRSLFKKYKKPEDFSRVVPEVLEKEIRQTGFFRNKAKNIISCSTKICDVYKNRVPDSMKDLISLAGVARKTANIVLSSVYGKAEGIAVDTHVKRLSNRLGISSEKNPDKIERELMGVVRRKDWIDFNYLMVTHGRKICDAKKPTCGKCVLSKICFFATN